MQLMSEGADTGLRYPRWAVGGDYELVPADLAGTATLLWPTGGTWTSSGRSALGLVLKKLKEEGVTKVHLPAYLCESIIQAAEACGCEISFYPVNQDLSSRPPFHPGEATVVIHYFGWLHSDTERLRMCAARGEGVLIEDASHAMLTASLPFSGWGSYTVLSPRKYLPCVLGGWCNVRAETVAPSPMLSSLTWRAVAARLVRGQYIREAGPIEPAIEAFYLSATEALEAYLNSNSGAESIPEVAAHILSSIDRNCVALRRRTNWEFLHAALVGVAEPVFPYLPEAVVPLGYVVRLACDRRDVVRARLRERRVFSAVHWSLPQHIESGSFSIAASLSGQLLTLPIDQRYTEADMKEIARLFSEITTT